MNCKHAHKLFGKSIDRMISPYEKHLLHIHLAECPRCAEEHAALGNVDCLLSKALPLQSTLGDGFAAQVLEKLPVRTNRLTILKEAFIMSRIKYPVAGMFVLIVAIVCLFMPHSSGNQAFAAMQSAMAKVKSLHFTYELKTQSAGHSGPEVWATPEAMKSVDGAGWMICKKGTLYNYQKRNKLLLITQLPSTDTGKIFAMMVDPREIAGIAKNVSATVTVRDLKYHGKSMRQIDVEQTPTEPSKQYKRLVQKISGIIAEQISRKGHSADRQTVTTMRAPRSKLVYLVDPSTNLVKSVNIYQHKQRDGGWTLILSIKRIDYNQHMHEDFFDTKTPHGTRVCDLRNYK